MVSGPMPAVARITPASLKVIICASRRIFLYRSLNDGVSTTNSFPFDAVTTSPSLAWFIVCAGMRPYCVLTSSCGVVCAKLRPVPLMSRRCIFIGLGFVAGFYVYSYRLRSLRK